MGDRTPHALPYAAGQTHDQPPRTSSDARDSLLIGIFGPVVTGCLAFMGFLLGVLIASAAERLLSERVQELQCAVITALFAAIYPTYGIRTAMAALRRESDHRLSRWQAVAGLALNALQLGAIAAIAVNFIVHR